jgi:hypothetical protein
MKNKLWHQIQKGLAEPRQPMEDPFKGFRDKPEEITCGCGLYVHPSRMNPRAIHIADCEAGQRIQEGLSKPPTRPLPEGFRKPMFEGLGHVNRAAIQRNIDRRAERKLQALVQAANVMRRRG